MAQSKGTAGRRTGGKTKRSTAANTRKAATDRELGYELRSEIKVIAAAAVAVFLFLCNFRICGKFGNIISDIMFGTFGITAYAIPAAVFVAFALLVSNGPSPAAVRKIISGSVILLLVAMTAELFTGRPQGYTEYQIQEIYKASVQGRNGGGIIGGSITWLSFKTLSLAGTVVLMLVTLLIAAMVFTEKSFVGGLKSGGKRFIERAGEGAEDYFDRLSEQRERDHIRREELREERRLRAEEREERRRQLQEEREEERRKQEEQQETEKILRRDRKVSGVMLDTELERDKEEESGYLDDDEPDDIVETTQDNIRRTVFIPGIQTGEDMHEISLNTDYEDDGYDEEPVMRSYDTDRYAETAFTPYADAVKDIHEIEIREEEPVVRPLPKAYKAEIKKEPLPDIPVHAEHIEADVENGYRIHTTDFVGSGRDQADAAVKPVKETAVKNEPVKEKEKPKKPPKPYAFPPLNLLHKGETARGDSAKTLRETAMKLQDTLETFNVRAAVTDISQGPSVTRYELQPEAGVKVSKIVALADDIKMYLAATDIRIEAPIPGKSAVGIEVPNKENTPVALRDLLESEEFDKSKSRLTVAIGKDIAGKTVITDIAKMPHLLIAGATGSGKSVCINTIIMSMLYKASPEEVRLIMIDPKIVELSVYNGIPHLLIPVVTDCKKAAAALSWAVSEMTERYKKFADAKVRDLAGYNAWCDANGDKENRMPEIVVIVDELADLMMQFRNEVEDSIVRLTQLARAAGIYLIIATQRPSVDVITGLIKANIPSRIAFAVSSGVDSRTILDSTGAEKLIGKGDMLFFPRGNNKPARVQGAFVSDEEVQKVTDFVRDQYVEVGYGQNVMEQISGMEITGGKSGGSSPDDQSQGGSQDGYDEFFEQAAHFIIEKDKASIGMLQRAYKIGFNRAARIMDQLCEAGVVGDEEGTKPRRILMTGEQFDAMMAERRG